MESLNKELIDILMHSRDIILTRGPTINTNPTGIHHRPRTTALERRGLSKLRKQVVAALRREIADQSDLPEEIQHALESHVPTNPNDENTAGPPTMERLKLLKIHIRKKLHSIDQQHQTKHRQVLIAKRQALYDRRQKIGNPIITGQYKGKNSMQLRALYNDAAEIVRAPDKVKDVNSQSISVPFGLVNSKKKKK
jgi:hypothetical protein